MQEDRPKDRLTATLRTFTGGKVKLIQWHVHMVVSGTSAL